MPQTRKKVRPVEIDMLCDECRAGYMRPTAMLPVYPPRYQHSCSNCEQRADYDRSYPFIIFE